MVHVALKLRSDVLSHPAFTGVNVNQEAEIASVPNSVHMFLNLLLEISPILMSVMNLMLMSWMVSGKRGYSVLGKISCMVCVGTKTSLQNM